ncbi:MAG: TRAM domain-containing protein, partial [Candidatus Bipolaricaulota bacterium]
TDIIVGHPGETEEDFRQTLNLIRKVDFGSIYAAKFSPRPGTKSAKLEDQVPQKVKEERLEKLLTLQKNRVKDVNRNYIGEHSEVLVEGTARKNGNMYGKNEFYKTVVFDGGPDLVGQMVEVTIRDVEEGTLYAERED